MIIHFGQTEHEFVSIDVRGYECDEIADASEDWVTCQVRLSAGGFTGGFSASLFTADLSRFLKSLVKIYDCLQGVAKLTSLEEQLELQVTGDGLGHILLRGIATDRAGDGNQLRFELEFDQTQLRSAVDQLEAVLRTYAHIECRE
jgi:hypothetical protein